MQVWSHYADRAPVAVTKSLPYTIRAVKPKAPLVQGGSIELKIVAERETGFENAIAIRTLYNPPGVLHESVAVDSEEENGSVDSDHRQRKGTHGRLENRIFWERLRSMAR